MPNLSSFFFFVFFILAINHSFWRWFHLFKVFPLLLRFSSFFFFYFFNLVCFLPTSLSVSSSSPALLIQSSAGFYFWKQKEIGSYVYSTIHLNVVHESGNDSRPSSPPRPPNHRSNQDLSFFICPNVTGNLLLALAFPEKLSLLTEKDGQSIAASMLGAWGTTSQLERWHVRISTRMWRTGSILKIASL